jgi:hypothetical protein
MIMASSSITHKLPKYLMTWICLFKIKKLKIQKLVMSDKLTPPKEGSIECTAFTGKKKTEPRLKGYAI